MKIYTKVGDKGTTRLVDGSTVAKHSPRVEAYGTVDELNSCLGVIISELNELDKLGTALLPETTALQKIQHHLFRIGSLVATENVEVFKNLPSVDDTQIRWVEHEIDRLTAELAPLKNFILPAGNKAMSVTHLARTIGRRAERRVSEVYAERRVSEVYADSVLETVATPSLLQNSLIYLNRLSDYLFTLARYIGLKTQTEEIKWDKTQ